MITPEGLAKFRAIVDHLKPAEITETDRIGLDDRIVDEVSEDDRRWFDDNPDAGWRLRPLVPGESPAQPVSRWMLVYQVETGLRIRTPLALDIDDETAAFLMRHGYFEWIDGQPVWFTGATFASQ